MTGLATLSIAVPVLPCSRGCRPIYEERLRHARQPQVTPEWAAAIRAYAVSDGCRDCRNSGRLTLFGYLIRNRWDLGLLL